MIFFVNANVLSALQNCGNRRCSTTYEAVENDIVGIGQQFDDSARQLKWKLGFMIIICAHG